MNFRRWTRARRSPIAGWRRSEGFTLLEMMIALLILGIVLGAVAPAFYGIMRAGTITNYKSVANGIAVQATEQMRSYPYYEVGFYTAQAGCPGVASSTPPVILDSSLVSEAPVQTLQTQFPTETVGFVTYNIQRCVSWVDSSVSADTLAYKQTYVQVSWTVDHLTSSISQTSALYPGGDGQYTSTENDYAPASTTTTIGTPPSAPTSVTVSADSSNPGYGIVVSWPAVSGATSYNVWFTSTNPGTSAVSTISGAQVDMDVTATSDVITVSPNTDYWIQVVAVSSGGDSSPTSANSYPFNSGAATSTTTTTVSSSSTTTSTSTTTTTVPCSATQISISPAGQNSRGNQAYLNSNDTLVANSGSFYVTVTLSGSGCVPEVAYNTTGCFPGTTGCTASYLTTYTLSGNQYTFTSDPTTTWTNKATEQFVPVVNSIQSTTLSAQSYVCVEDGNSGNCK